jgi:hypothetical protein
VGVDHGGGNIGMTEQFLDGADIGATGSHIPTFYVELSYAFMRIYQYSMFVYSQYID